MKIAILTTQALDHCEEADTAAEEEVEDKAELACLDCSTLVQVVLVLGHHHHHSKLVAGIAAVVHHRHSIAVVAAEEAHHSSLVVPY